VGAFAKLGDEGPLRIGPGQAEFEIHARVQAFLAHGLAEKGVHGLVQEEAIVFAQREQMGLWHQPEAIEGEGVHLGGLFEDADQAVVREAGVPALEGEGGRRADDGLRVQVVAPGNEDEIEVVEPGQAFLAGKGYHLERLGGQGRYGEGEVASGVVSHALLLPRAQFFEKVTTV